MADEYSMSELPKIARKIRRGIIESVHAAGSGHPGGALGITDVLTALYFKEMNIDPEKPDWKDRDRFVLSPAHMVTGLYATLAHRGFMSVEELKTLRQFGSKLQGHAYRDLDIGVETTGGSLGQGLSVAIGFALAGKMDDASYRTYCMISDGELNEGQTWEALMFASREKLNNLFIILDRNNIQLSDHTEDIMPLEPILEKLSAFNFNVIEIDGHDFTQILFAFDKAKLSRNKANIILSNTTAGKGVSFMEGMWQWHGKAPDDDEFKIAMAELE